MQNKNNSPIRNGSRRGSVLVLVAGILVLLVIIASAYLSRANAERTVAFAQRQTGLRDDRANVVADDLAQIIASALFIQPVELGDPELNDITIGIPSSDWPRLPMNPTAVRYGVTSVTNGNGVEVYYGAPYQVSPWTNWPDGIIDPFTLFPRVDDMTGNPGFNDTRWLRSSEPHRFVLAGNKVIASEPDDVEFFSHWLHMTNIATANNGYRIVKDISDVLGFNHLVTDLVIPVEQFLPDVASDALDTVSGHTFVPGDFETRWDAWFFDALAYEASYGDPTRIPPNFLMLNDLIFDSDASGQNQILEPGERPQDEFIRGTARWVVGTRLTDTDGDGRTDSFWFLSPNMLEGGIRQIIGVSIVDNAGMLNANVATQFVRGDPFVSNGSDLLGTIGHTPTDLALFEHTAGSPATPGQVGFLLDAQHNELVFPSGALQGDPLGPYSDYEYIWDPITWDGGVNTETFLGELGILSRGGQDYNVNPGNVDLAEPEGRRDWWRRGASRPLDPQVDVLGFNGLVYTPFTLADEMELRSFAGQNVPWTMSRFERSLNLGANRGFMRTTISREETSEYLDQLGIWEMPSGAFFDELLHDQRHRMTLFSGARNDLIPPWLRWEYRTTWALPPALSNDQQFTFLEQSRRKMDLREDPLTFAEPGDPNFNGAFPFAYRLPWMLLETLTSRDAVGNNLNLGAYFYHVTEIGTNDYERTQRLAASYAANILSYRDPEFAIDGFTRHAPYSAITDTRDIIPVPLLGGGDFGNPQMGTYDLNVRYMGMEKQPFLVEAFIGHVYEASRVVPNPGGSEYTNSGQPIVSEDDFKDTIIVIQIANPFDTPLDLGSGGFNFFKLVVFGQDVLLDGIIRPGEARTYISIDASDQDRLDDWKEALELNPIVGEYSEIWGDPIIISPQLYSQEDRATYDGGTEEEAIELYRFLDDGAAGIADVLIDRIDIHADDPIMMTQGFANDFEFGEVVTDDLEDEKPLVWPPPGIPLPNLGLTWPGVVLPMGDTHWIQWARASRKWWDDIDNTLIVEDDEKSPRYVFASRFVEDDDTGRSFNNANPPVDWMGTGGSPTEFDTKEKDINDSDLEPEIDLDDFTLQMLQKDADFEQVGELLNVWLFSHQLAFLGGVLDDSGSDHGTTITFSEFMSHVLLVGDNDRRVNRLRVQPNSVTESGSTMVSSRVIGRVDQGGVTLIDIFPSLPAGLRVLDAFVCDDRGLQPPDADGDGSNFPSFYDEESARFRNAMGFSGLMTPGVINVNTASREVFRALPHWSELVHRSNLYEDSLGITIPIPNILFTQTRLPNAIELYREKLGDPLNLASEEPPYFMRGIVGDVNSYIPGMRREAGIASPAEVLLLGKSGRRTTGLPQDNLFNDSWEIDFAAENPFRDLVGNPNLPVDVDLSTDVQTVIDPVTFNRGFDEVSGDVEEANLLFAGASNLLSTTSDVFTVYFRVRSFKQRQDTGVWDATDPEHIVDERRYVMLVDRSQVNSPSDRPKILYIEQLPK